jgi:hypothetical protein
MVLTHPQIFNIHTLDIHRTFHTSASQVAMEEPPPVWRHKSGGTVDQNNGWIWGVLPGKMWEFHGNLLPEMGLSWDLHGI